MQTGPFTQTRRNALRVLAGLPLALHAQTVAKIGSVPGKPWLSSTRREFTAPELLDAPDEWIERSFAWVDDMLRRFPPGIPEHPVRRAALIRLDDILHIDSAPKKPIVQEYFKRRMADAIAEIEKTPVREGARIWKLYNHGFLVRTPAASWTFDLVPGPPRVDGFSITGDMLERLVTQSDATFVSHMHADHANADVARLFLKQGKAVVLPEGLWSDRADLAGRVTYPTRSTSEVTEVGIRAGKERLRVVAHPGHQGATVTNNVHLVRSPDGFAALQTGDQWFEADFEWMAHIGSRHNVDVMLPNCWTMDIQRMARGVNPRLIITGHENEMAHTVPHREDYTQTWNRLHGSQYPLVLMTWGESFRLI
jgi:L-ascorbate metabolism protein UlaG (beta-lactamase superfamily)